ncbi:MAG TPA: DNA topoisomerase I, partial [Acidaminococcaceae bacterium]|nr:DNA topoisomerase I [Acidaminococcaceae bacterium]
TKEQYRLYKLIWDRTMACQMAPAKYDQTTLQIAAGNYELKASGSVMTFDGFMRLADKKDMKKEGSGPVPYIEPGRSLVLHKVEHGVQHFTEPPASYTEASLVKKMEEEGIGRPSTYAPIIQTIQSRGYVVKDGKKLVATDLGKKVVDLLTTYFGSIINIPYSAAMETELDEIAEHKEDKLTVLRNFYGPFEALLEKADKVIPKDPPPLEKSGVICEKCGREMVIREGRYGKFLACPGFPECRNTKPLLEKIGVSCPQCGGDITVRHTRTNKVFYGCSNYPECKFTSWDKPTNETCPKCGHMLLEHAERGGKVRRVCSNPDCEDALSKRPSRKKTTTADLLKVKKVVKGRETRKTAAKKTSARKTASAATKSKAARK